MSINPHTRPPSRPALPRVLMIAYFFPPIGGSGALRPLKLAKFLPRHGWQPVILTVKNPDWYYARDPALLEDLPPEAIIVRTPMLRSAWMYRVLNPLRIKRIDAWIRRWCLHPDDQVGWIPFAIPVARRLATELQISAVYSTSSPLSCHLIARRLARTRQLPWISDFRDEWYENPDFDFPTRAHRRLHYGLEGDVVRSSARVIAPAPEFCRLLSKHCPGSSKFKTLPMGFDAGEIAALKPSAPAQEPSRPFTLAFAGLFYGSFRPARLIGAVEQLIGDGQIDSRKIKIRFVGANRAEETGCADRYGICEFTGFVSHRIALGALAEADALLLLLSRDRGEHVIPSKTFEYLGIGKPILALIPQNGDLADIIRRTRAGLVVDFEDLPALKAAFLKLYRAWERGQSVVRPDATEIARYSQSRIAGRFAGLLDDIVAAAKNKPIQPAENPCAVGEL